MMASHLYYFAYVALAFPAMCSISPVSTVCTDMNTAVIITTETTLMHIHTPYANALEKEKSMSPAHAQQIPTAQMGRPLLVSAGNWNLETHWRQIQVLAQGKQLDLLPCYVGLYTRRDGLLQAAL